MIRIKNTSKIAQIISLAPTKDIGVDTIVNQRVGQASVRKHTRRLGDSVRLQPGEVSRELPGSVKHDPTVAQLIRRGIVSLVKI